MHNYESGGDPPLLAGLGNRASQPQHFGQDTVVGVVMFIIEWLAASLVSFH